MAVSHLQKYHKGKFFKTNYYYCGYELYVMKAEYKYICAPLTQIILCVSAMAP